MSYSAVPVRVNLGRSARSACAYLVDLHLLKISSIYRSSIRTFQSCITVCVKLTILIFKIIPKIVVPICTVVASLDLLSSDFSLLLLLRVRSHHSAFF